MLLQALYSLPTLHSSASPAWSVLHPVLMRAFWCVYHGLQLEICTLYLDACPLGSAQPPRRCATTFVSLDQHPYFPSEYNLLRQDCAREDDSSCNHEFQAKRGFPSASSSVPLPKLWPLRRLPALVAPSVSPSTQAGADLYHRELSRCDADFCLPTRVFLSGCHKRQLSS